MSEHIPNTFGGKVLHLFIEGFAFFGKAASSFVLFPEPKTFEEVQTELSEKYKGFGLNFDFDGKKSDKENLASDWAKVGNDLSEATKKAITKLENK